MSLILSIETSTPLCSVALHRAGVLVGTRESIEEGAHAKQLTLLIEALMSSAEITGHDLDAIAISLGPGSYTGLRIGLSTAKGLCFGLDKPLIALDTLKILAYGRKGQKFDYLIPMLDARRMEVYTAVFESNNLINHLETQAMILDENSLIEFTARPSLIFGNGAMKWKEAFPEIKGVFEADVPYPAAQCMGDLAYQAFLNQEFENIVTLEPNYLKEFQGTKPKVK
jgi:tRNA threonylcarbamoyladenosine biosynthesis protein TsaB